MTLALYVHLGRRLLLQLEALVGLLLLPLAEGKGVSVMEQQQAALEVMTAAEGGGVGGSRFRNLFCQALPECASSACAVCRPSAARCAANVRSL